MRGLRRQLAAADSNIATYRSCARFGIMRFGFTLIELLIVIGIVSVLMGLLLPAVRKVRESANRTRCLHNLRQVGLAIVQFENNKGFFAPGGIAGGIDFPQMGFSVTNQTGWPVFLLPYVEQQAVYDAYHFDQSWAWSDNRTAVGSVVPVFLCPSDLYPSTTMYHAANQSQNGRISYSAWSKVWAGLRDNGGLGFCDNLGNDVNSSAYHGVMRIYGSVQPSGTPPQRFLCRVGDVRDGLSNTMIIAEKAGRPRGFARLSSPVGSTNTGNWGFEDSEEFCGSKTDGTPCGPCAVNCNNLWTIFSFHPGGAASLFADGSVRFLSDNISIRIIGRMITRNGGEVIDSSDF